MKTTELMIGDWIMWKPQRGGFIGIVGGDEAFKPELTRVRASHLDSILTDYHPIPLTVELLNNNGGAYNRIDTEEHTIYYRYSADGGVFIELIEDGDEMTPSRTIFAKELDYVHQYQHLLRLCGLNELADNFQI